jgi:diguanylate cyclase (GGDEF)-like protein/PAS domain S-box-containing protein
MLQMLGFGPGDLSPHASELDARTHPDDVAQMQCDREAHFSGQAPSYRNEHRLQCKDGSWLWVLSRGMVVSRDDQGRPLRMIGTLTDITSRKHAELLIWHQAHFDVLTGLPNRRLLRQQLDALMAQAERQGTALAVVFLDLDRFKEVNDTLGHNVGDALLVEVAHRIQQRMGAGHALARMGGDEFTLVFALPAGQDPVAVLRPRLQALLHTLAQPYRLGSDHVFVSASMGVAVYPRDAQRVEDLFRHADQALYAAKGAGRNRVNFFTPDLQAAAQRRASLDAELRLALAHNQLTVVYQPIVALDTGHIAKAEALLRWQHPELGAVSPAEFIPVAEANGQIVPMGDWVFEQATAQVTRWRHLFDARFQISVNKSPVQCHHHVAHGSSWAQRLQDKGLPCDSVAMEITEGLLLDISPEVTQHLADLRDAGMAVSLDDFGTGYSSFTYLQKLAIDFIKIDQSFVRHLAPGSTDLALCTAVIAMANALGMKVVAEGVETELQRDLLRQAGCHFGQGYLFARPMGPAAFEEWFTANNPAARTAP